MWLHNDGVRQAPLLRGLDCFGGLAFAGVGGGLSLEVLFVKNRSCLAWGVSRLGDDGASQSFSFRVGVWV
jgi:hypothetical protein